MEHSELHTRVSWAIDMLYARDSALFRRDPSKWSSEWSIAHRLAVYLEHQLPEWNVDCEYNRQGQDSHGKKSANSKNIRPDIIVHHRGCLERAHNLLVIEVKKDRTDTDLERAREFTAPRKGERSFQYQHGLALSVVDGPILDWFMDGKPSTCHCMHRT